MHKNVKRLKGLNTVGGFKKAKVVYFSVDNPANKSAKIKLTIYLTSELVRKKL